MLDLAHAAAVLGLDIQTLYRRIHDRTITVVPIGGKARIALTSLEKLMGRPVSFEEYQEAVARHASHKEERNARLRAKRRVA